MKPVGPDFDPAKESSVTGSRSGYTTSYFFGIIFNLGGALIILSGIGILLSYAYQWLKGGTFTSLSISYLISPKPTSWVGLNQIIGWLTDLPLWLGAFVAGGLAFLMGNGMLAEADELRRRLKAKQSPFN